MRPRFPTDHEPTIEVRPALGRFEDVVTLVGTRTPGAGACWCLSYRDSRIPNAERPDAVAALCDTEPGPGVLAYVDDVAAGWCSVAPRSQYRRLLRSRTIPVLEDGPGGETWVAVCFVVRAGFRRHGLMDVLLDGAVDHAARHGAGAVEGYPVDLRPDERVDVISGYVGTTRLFARAGFTRAAATTAHSGGRERVVMRRVLDR